MSTLAAKRAIRRTGPGRYVVAGVIALFGLIASVTGYLAVAASQRHVAELNLANLAMSHRQILDGDLTNATDLLRTLHAYFDAKAVVSREEYQVFAKRLRERLVGLRNTGWAPRVTRDERAEFERKIREGGFPNFEIWERDLQGNRIRAGDRAEYFPILYPDPVTVTSQTLGFDIGSEAVRADALRRARVLDRPSATPPINLITKQQPDGFMSFLAVYRRGAGSADSLAGFVYGVFETAPMIERILAAKTRPAGLDIYFYNPLGPVDNRLIHWHSSRTRGVPAPVPRESALLAGAHWQGTFSVADQAWGVIFAPTDALAARAVSPVGIVTLAAGLLMTGMIVAYLLLSVRRTVRLEALTDHVRAANSDLLALRSAFDDIDTGVMLIDANLRVQFTNRAARHIWSLSARTLADHPSLPDLIYSALDLTSQERPSADLVAYLAGLLAGLREGTTSSEDLALDSGEVIRCQSVTLPDGGWMLSYSRVTDLVRQSEQLAKLANSDAMTGALNRRRFVELADAEWRRFARYGQPLSLLLLDIDLFKTINDRFGHDIGDDVIRAVANTCVALLRDGDIFGRIGGEEFALLLPQADLAHACVVAERIRRQVEEVGMRVAGQAVRVTVSIGVAQAGAGTADIKALLKSADLALYEAKHKGRNLVSIAASDIDLAPHPSPPVSDEEPPPAQTWTPVSRPNAG